MKYKISSEYVYEFNKDSTLDSFKDYLRNCIGSDKDAEVRFKELSFLGDNIIIVFYKTPLQLKYIGIIMKDNFSRLSKEDFEKYYEIA